MAICVEDVLHSSTFDGYRCQNIVRWHQANVFLLIFDWVASRESSVYTRSRTPAQLLFWCGYSNIFFWYFFVRISSLFDSHLPPSLSLWVLFVFALFLPASSTFLLAVTLPCVCLNRILVMLIMDIILIFRTLHFVCLCLYSFLSLLFAFLFHFILGLKMICCPFWFYSCSIAPRLSFSRSLSLLWYFYSFGFWWVSEWVCVVKSPESHHTQITLHTNNNQIKQFFMEIRNDCWKNSIL